jgi:hypothetical protein
MKIELGEILLCHHHRFEYVNHLSFYELHNNPNIRQANVLHGFVAENEVEPVMDNINRIIKSGGIFSVVEFRKIENNPGPPFNVKLSPEQVTEILAQYGFDTINTQKIGTFHYIVNGLRKP